MWFDANPDQALALLSDDEADALASLATKPAVGAASAGLTVPVDASFDIISYLGCCLGFRVRSSYFNVSFCVTHMFYAYQFCGLLAVVEQSFNGQILVFLKTPIKTFTIKGPKIDGSVKDGIHIGPVNIPLPYVGALDVWAKVDGKNLVITVKVIFFGKPYLKKFTVAMPA